MKKRYRVVHRVESDIRIKHEAITTEEQLRRWADGDPVHNDTPRFITMMDEDGFEYRRLIPGGECCPDFSCCNPQLLAAEPVRRAYLAGGESERRALLVYFLGALMDAEATEERVHIAGTGRDES